MMIIIYVPPGVQRGQKVSKGSQKKGEASVLESIAANVASDIFTWSSWVVALGGDARVKGGTGGFCIKAKPVWRDQHSWLLLILHST